MKLKIFYGFIFICITRVIGMVFFPVLLKFSPLLLIILSPFLHHLILTSSLIPLPLFLFTGIIISLIQCTLGYEFGRRYGVISLEWSKKHNLISPSKIDLVIGWLRYSAPVVLFLIPGPLIAMIAGVSNLKPKYFFIPMIPAQILWISACYLLGVELEVYLNLVKAFIIEHSIAITCALIMIRCQQTCRKK